MLEKFVMPLRIGEAVLGLIVLGLLSYEVHVIHHYFSGANPGGYSQGLWGFLLGAILLAVKVVLNPENNNATMAVALVDIITAIFFFAGFIAVASLGLDCGSSAYESDFTKDLRTACRCVNSAAAMGAFSWVLWTISAVISVPPAFAVAKANGGGGNSSNPPPSDNPS